MSRCFIVKSVYNARAIKAMTTANYHLYQSSIVKKVYAIGLLLLCIGLVLSTSSLKTLATILLLIGCIVLANGEFPAHQAAKAILASFSQNTQEVEFHFFQDNICIYLSNQSETINYTRIQKISENRDYFILFLGPGNAYVIDKSSFTLGTIQGFRPFITQKTSLQLESPSLIRIIFKFRLGKKIS